jgi:O-antigen/teichoic acid export membrane protein
VPADPPVGEPSRDSEQAGWFWRDRRWRVRLAQTTVATWIAAGLTMLSVVVAARALGPESYGSVVLALSVTAVAARFLDFTFGEAVVHHGHQALAAGDTSGLRALMNMSLKLDFAIGVAIAGLLFALAAPLAQLAAADGIEPALVRIAALGVLAVTVDGTTSAVLLVAGRPDLRAWAQTAATLFRVIGVLVAVAVGGGAEAILLSYVVSGAVSSMLLGWVAWRVAWREWTRAPKGQLPVNASSLLRFAAHSSATTSVEAAGESLFPLLLGNLAGPGAVGVFRVAMLPVIASDMLSRPLRLVLFPEQARLHAERKIAELRRATSGYTALAFSLALPAAIVGWFAMPTLIEVLFSSSFDGAVTAARILLIAAVFHFSLAWSKSFHAAVGRPQIRTRLSALSLALSLLILLLLGDRGAEGAAIAYTVGVVASASVWLVIVHRYLSREVAVVEADSADDATADEEALAAEEAVSAELELPTPAGGR